jgi:hypothetical protein
MLKKEYTLSDVVEYFKRHKVPSFEEDIDEFGGYFITAARIGALLLSPDPRSALENFCSGVDAASLRVSKLFSWLPDKFKYGNKGREKFAIQRYELSSIIYVKLFDIALLNSFNDTVSPILKKILSEVEIQESEKEDLRKLIGEAEKDQLKLNIDTFAKIDRDLLNTSFRNILVPILSTLNSVSARCKKGLKPESNNSEIDLKNMEEKFCRKAYLLFNMFLINFSSEFPDFALWCDVTMKDDIYKELGQIKKNISAIAENKKKSLLLHKSFESSVRELIGLIENAGKDEFLPAGGFHSFDAVFDNLFKLQTDNIIEKLDEQVRANIFAHHTKIRKDVEVPLSDNDDIEEIIYPKNKEIYIAQSFQSIEYRKKEHKKIFLTAASMNSMAEKGEDVGKFLLRKLIDPNSSRRPIIVLGNPGAGKSMFSKMLAAKLCDTNDYVPFMIRLRDVASSSGNISEHINKGIALSIGLSQEINWIDWAKLFKSRTPVIILDGFDELMQSSDVELNGYIVAIKDLQDTASNHNISLKLILTSRITVMQDVTIPDGTTIVKLNSFDDSRKNLWIDTWNSFQTKSDYKFILPQNEKILDLAQEPLLLFMLAVYDFPSAELQKMALDKSFNQSKLYDSLLSDFGLRQLNKEHFYENASQEVKSIEEELFRLRLGMIALLMFLNDTTSKEIQRLEEELKVCKLDGSKIKSVDVLTGFFFVHQNKSTTENEVENYNYEFLHKSFGEFLTADFLLRIALKQKERATKDLELFNFCYGYNWLNKQPEILRFLFEHAPHVFDFSRHEQARMIEDIQDSLVGIFDQTVNSFPISRFTIVDPKSKVEHLAIYSQNVILLWLSLCEVESEISFRILPGNIASRSAPKIGKQDEIFNYLAQDREEINQDKLLWKRITSLWQLVGNFQSVAKLNEWIEVNSTDNVKLRRRIQKIDVRNNFSEAASVSCNDFTYIISLYDLENKDILRPNLFSKLSKIYKNKPELQVLGNDALIFRIGELTTFENTDIFDFLLRSSLLPRQLSDLTERFVQLGDSLSDISVSNFGKTLFELSYEKGAAYSQLILLNYLVKFKHMRPVWLIFDGMNGILDVIVRNALEIDKEDHRYFFQFFRFVNALSHHASIQWLVNSKMFLEVISRFGREIEYYTRNNIQLSIEYLRAIRTLPRNFRTREYINNSFFQHAIDQLIFNIELRNGQSFYYLLEYLKVVDDLRGFGRFKGIFDAKNFSALMERYEADLHYMSREDPEAVMDFLELVRKSGIDRYVHRWFLRIFDGIFDGLFNKPRRRSFENLEFTTRYLRLINYYSKYYPMYEIMPMDRWHELTSRFGRDSTHLMRQNLNFLTEFLLVTKNLNLVHGIEDYFGPDFYDEIYNRLLGMNPVLTEMSGKYTGEYIRLISVLLVDFDLLSRINKERVVELEKRLQLVVKYYKKKKPEILIDYIRIINQIGRPEWILNSFPELREAYAENPQDFTRYFELFATTIRA